MAYYCVKCGRKLPDGAICPCRIRWGAPGQEGGQPARSSVSFQNILRLNDPDYDRNTDYYERGKQIVPDLVAPCENEIPIKQYHIVDIRSRLQGLWAEGRIMVTNKRLLFRASGRSFIGRTRLEQEYELDEISGINISHGVRFSLFDFFNSFLLAALCGALVFLLLGQEPAWLLPLLLTAGCIAGMYFLGRKRYRWKLVLSAAGAMSAVKLLLWAQVGQHTILGGLFTAAMTLLFIAAMIFLFMSGMKPVVSLAVMCKAGTDVAIGYQSMQQFRLQTARELLPTAETEIAIREVGAIINDIQRLGDYGIEKWRSAAREAQTA